VIGEDLGELGLVGQQLLQRGGRDLGERGVVRGEEDTAVGEEAAGEDVAPEAAGEDEDELHAAAPRLRLTARPDRARRRYFMILTP
jgi:hypothetical protein